MNDPKLGELITGDAHRDAIHIAIAPVIAGEHALAPGEHVAVRNGRAVRAIYEECVGIIDPFLRDEVPKEKRCFVFLYPKTISGLRHAWSHPAFPEDGPALIVQPQDSVQWMSAFASEHKLTLQQLMDGATAFLESGQRLDNDFADWETPPEFWEHYTKLTGRAGSGELFGCCV